MQTRAPAGIRGVSLGSLGRVLCALVVAGCGKSGSGADGGGGGNGVGSGGLGAGGGAAGGGGTAGGGNMSGAGGSGGASGVAGSSGSGTGGSGGGRGVAGTVGSGGEGGAGGALASVSSISKDGITWTFSHAAPAGQFVNGDWYVVGPVTVTAIDPAPTNASPYLNGSVLNLPTKNGKSGFDSRLNDGSDQSDWFDASLRAALPLALAAGDALVSSRSLATPHTLPEEMRSGGMNISPVASESILTVLGTAAAPDAFRPSYCDRGQTLHHAGDLQRNLLPSLAPPNPTMTPALAQFETLFRRPWVDTPGFNFDVPAEYMPSYGAEVASAVGFASLTLALSFQAADKVALTNYLVQYGIDLYGCVKAGSRWPAFGGHRSGRKLPIILAAVLFGDSAMKNVSTDYPDAFGEDMHTVYVNQLPGGFAQAWQGATVIYGGHYGVHADGTPVSAGLYGPYEQLQPKDWPLLTPTEQLGEAYRRCCTSLVFVGEALAMHLLKAESVWNHPAFFDYVDRWMTEDDTQAIADIKTQSGFDYSADWERQRQTKGYFQGEFPQYSFIDDMWAAYRH